MSRWTRGIVGVICLVARFPLISRRAGSRKGARTFSGSKLPALFVDDVLGEMGMSLAVLDLVEIDRTQLVAKSANTYSCGFGIIL